MDYVEWIKEKQTNFLRAPITMARMNIIACAFILSEFSKQTGTFVPFIVQIKVDPETDFAWYIQLVNRASYKVVLGGYIRKGYIELWQKKVKELLDPDAE